MQYTSQSLVKPVVKIDSIVKQKIMHWVNASSYECSGIGKLLIENGEIRVIDAILLPQKNTSATTDIDAEDLGKAMFLLKDQPGELRFWWHSHVNMSVFWSGTDMATIRSIGSNGWFVSSVFNKKWESRTCLYMKKPFETFIDEIPLIEYHAIPADVRARWDEEYKANVRNIPEKRDWATPGDWLPSRGGTINPLHMTKRQKKEARKKHKQLLFSPAETHEMISVADPVDLCPLCGCLDTCRCDDQQKESAQYLLAAGYCPWCGDSMDKCDCTQSFRGPAKKGPPASLNGSTGGVY